MPSYDYFEHTADIGIRIYGKDLETLFRNGAEGLFGLVTDLESMRQTSAREFKTQKKISLKSENEEGLFFEWLRELLFLFSSTYIIPVELNFKRITNRELEAECQMVRFNPKVHEQKYEVKAITYHHFKFEKQKEGYVAEIIVDL
jgi:SHS2 domain-containing protein